MSSAPSEETWAGKWKTLRSLLCISKVWKCFQVWADLDIFSPVSVWKQFIRIQQEVLLPVFSISLFLVLRFLILLNPYGFQGNLSATLSNHRVRAAFKSTFLYCELNTACANSSFMKDLLPCIPEGRSPNCINQPYLWLMHTDDQWILKILLLLEVWLHQKQLDHILIESNVQKSDPMKATVTLVGLRNEHYA